MEEVKIAGRGDQLEISTIETWRGLPEYQLPLQPRAHNTDDTSNLTYVESEKIRLVLRFLYTQIASNLTANPLDIDHAHCLSQRPGISTLQPLRMI